MSGAEYLSQGAEHPEGAKGRKRMGHVLVLCLVFGLLALQTACAPYQDTGIAYSLSGPRLVIVGDYNGVPLEGLMDRHVLVGVGNMELYSADPEQRFFCSGRIDEPPTEKARVRGVLQCSNDAVLLMTIRPLGPDQGVGIGRLSSPESELADGSPLVVFFSHPCKEEAVRRLPLILEDIARAQRHTQQ